MLRAAQKSSETGLRRMVSVSGDGRNDTVHLVGAAMVRLVGAIPLVQDLLGEPVIVGGLAVMCRLGNAHRHRGSGYSAASSCRGRVRVDVLELRVADLERDFTDATDRLEATAHRWTLETATQLQIQATSDPFALADDGDTVRAVALVACPGPLVAMKLKASVDRGTSKAATDLLGVVRLVTDPETAPDALDDFERVDSQLRADVAEHARLQFEQREGRTRQLIRGLGSQAPDEALVDAAAAFSRACSATNTKLHSG